MNDLEDRLRGVMRDAAEHISPHRVPPLRAAPPRRSRPGGTRPGAPHGQRWRTRLAPVAAAAAIVGLAAGSLTAVHALDAAGPGGRAAAAPGIPASKMVQIPPFYAALVYSGRLGFGAPGVVQVRNTATGQVKVNAAPPQGEKYVAVSGNASGNTFVLAAASAAEVTARLKHRTTATGLAATAQAERFYLLRYQYGTTTAQVTPLPIPEVPGVTWFALSPDGTELAVASASAATVTVSAYSVATGSVRTWTESTHQGGQHKWLGDYELSWIAGQRLAFGLAPASSSGQGLVGLLDTTSAGGNLLTHSHVFPPGPCVLATFSSDGNLALGGFLQHQSWLQECKISHGTATVTVPHLMVQCPNGSPALWDVLPWVSASGQTIVISISCGALKEGMTGVLAGRQVEPLPRSASIPFMGAFPGSPIAW